jgi:hypothetical protein
MHLQSKHLANVLGCPPTVRRLLGSLVRCMVLVDLPRINKDPRQSRDTRTLSFSALATAAFSSSAASRLSPGSTHESNSVTGSRERT